MPKPLYLLLNNNTQPSFMRQIKQQGFQDLKGEFDKESDIKLPTYVGF